MLHGSPTVGYISLDYCHEPPCLVFLSGSEGECTSHDCTFSLQFQFRLQRVPHGRTDFLIVWLCTLGTVMGTWRRQGFDLSCSLSGSRLLFLPCALADRCFTFSEILPSLQSADLTQHCPHNGGNALLFLSYNEAHVSQHHCTTGAINVGKIRLFLFLALEFGHHLANQMSNRCLLSACEN